VLQRAARNKYPWLCTTRLLRCAFFGLWRQMRVENNGKIWCIPGHQHLKVARMQSNKPENRIELHRCIDYRHTPEGSNELVQQFLNQAPPDRSNRLTNQNHANLSSRSRVYLFGGREKSRNVDETRV